MCQVTWHSEFASVFLRSQKGRYMYAMKLPLTVVIATFVFSFNAVGQTDESKSEVVAFEELEWGYLNPARGTRGPAAADLWGDRTSDTASGILLQFPQGFESPPHIHNVTYRGVVITGELHNANSEAATMWMPAGSFWIQPAGGEHVTAANGKKNIAFIEINNGPYLVLPTAEAFDQGESQINIDVSDIVWTGSTETISLGHTGAEVSHLWDEYPSGPFSGTLLKLPAGFSGEMGATAKTLRAVVIQGRLNYRHESGDKELAPGSYFGSVDGSSHQFYSGETEPVVLYVRSNGGFQVRSRLVSSESD